MLPKVRAVPKGWVLLAELYPRSDEVKLFWEPKFGIHFSNGEAILGLATWKKYNPRLTLGVARLYRSKLGHPKFRTSRNVTLKVFYKERTHGSLPNH
jgi:hypothetical protein